MRTRYVPKTKRPNTGIDWFGIIITTCFVVIMMFYAIGF